MIASLKELRAELERYMAWRRVSRNQPEATSEASPEAPALPAAAQEKETSDTSLANTADEKEATTEKGPPAVVKPSPMVITVTTPPFPAFEGPELGMPIVAALTSKNPKSVVSDGGKRIPVCIANRRFKKKRRPKQKDPKTMEILGWPPDRRTGGFPQQKDDSEEKEKKAEGHSPLARPRSELGIEPPDMRIARGRPRSSAIYFEARIARETSRSAARLVDARLTEKEKGGGSGEPPCMSPGKTTSTASCVSPGKTTSTAALRAPSVHLVGRPLQGEETKELRAKDEEKRPELSRAHRRLVGCSLSVEEPPTESSGKGL
ncbi:unnamed protein product [Linum trigynum]|uniref:Uncharacterized protein n=1 Tax=Linum trigynum TaxID=586398 RepID=A0AAV2E964_9ROSI